MNKETKLSNRIVAIILIALGLVLAVTRKSTGFSAGDYIFTTLGLPTWSNGTTGTHYPAVIGSLITLLGIGLLNCTLTKKAQWWLWTIVILLLIAYNIIFTYM